jgi:hypothetical protein
MNNRVFTEKGLPNDLLTNEVHNERRLKTSSDDFPEGVFSGTRAITTQLYTEANIKNGTQHEGSTLLTIAGNQNNDTIFLTGSLPVSLKTRSIGFTGDGVSSFIYQAPTYTGGSAVAYQNPNAINPITGLSQIIVGSTVSADGVLIFAPSHFIGNTSKQGKGGLVNQSGQEKILKPNTAYLFRITSLDGQSQQVSSTLSWYEGLLDLPLP